MFRSFIYFDEKKMYTYLKQIDNGYLSRPLNTSKKVTKEASLGMKGLGFSAQSEVNENREFNQDRENDYDRFEKALVALSDTEYFDFVLNPEYDIKTLPQMSIIRIAGRFQIPEELDMYTIAQQFMPIITSHIEAQDGNGKEILDTYLGKASADIPIVMDDEEVAITGRLNTHYLLEDYAGLDDYSEQEVIILCKVIGIMNKEKVEIFNPLKDFIKLPRTFRRSMDSNSKEFNPIVIDGPVLKVEIIAIYK